MLVWFSFFYVGDSKSCDVLHAMGRKWVITPAYGENFPEDSFYRLMVLEECPLLGTILHAASFGDS